MWDKLLFLTLITAFFPWSLLVLLWLFGWDETVCIFRDVVLDTFGSAVITVVIILMIFISLLVIGLAIFWAYKDIDSFLAALIVFGFLIGLSALNGRNKNGFSASHSPELAFDPSASTTDFKNNNDENSVKNLSPPIPTMLTKIPEGLEGIDWLARYAKFKHSAKDISVGPRVVVTAFGAFEKGDIVHLKAIGKKTCYVNGISVKISIVAENTCPIDESGLIPHHENA